MIRKEKIIYLLFSTGIFIGVLLAIKDIKIEKLTKENNDLQQEITDYKWQIAQVPYIIESWCNGE